MSSTPSSPTQSGQPVDPALTLRRQQVKLFCHLTQILCHLLARISWQELPGNQMRRVRPLMLSLQDGLSLAQSALDGGVKSSRIQPKSSEYRKSKQPKPLP